MNKLMGQVWWKLLAAMLVYYVLAAGFLIKVPRLFILNETIRNTFFHVALWFSMILLLLVSVAYALRYLGRNDLRTDAFSFGFASMGLTFGLLGVATGSLWARYTWGDWWVNDPKLNATTIALLIYLAYFLLRASIEDEHQRARISAIYNIFAFAAMIPLIFILPRLTDSLHPGSGGTPGFNAYDLDNKLRLVFYPAILAWTAMGVWLGSQRIRIRLLELRLEELRENERQQ